MDATTKLTGYDMFKIRQKEEAAANELFRMKQMNASERLFGYTPQNDVFGDSDVSASAVRPKDTAIQKNENGVSLTYAEYSYDDYLCEVFKYKSEGDEALCRDKEEYYEKRARMRRPIAAVKAEERYLATGETENQEAHVAPVKKARRETTESVSLLDRILRRIDSKAEFKKGGKIFIVAYVIIVLLVALVLIVTSTVLPGNDASASAPEETVSEDTVKSMNLTPEEEETNWFDRLCDSVSK